MKKSDLKKAIKPLVKECIQEILIEEGMLSNIVSEVATGLQGNLVVESKERATTKQLFNQKVARSEATQSKLKEQKKRMLDAIGKDAYNGVDLFEGTNPMSSYEASEQKQGSIDLGNPGDAGVDISSLLGGASKIWEAMK